VADPERLTVTNFPIGEDCDRRRRHHCCRALIEDDTIHRRRNTLLKMGRDSLLTEHCARTGAATILSGRHWQIEVQDVDDGRDLNVFGTPLQVSRPVSPGMCDGAKVALGPRMLTTRTQTLDLGLGTLEVCGQDVAITSQSERVWHWRMLTVCSNLASTDQIVR
jgi:hypothetical protein